MMYWVSRPLNKVVYINYMWLLINGIKVTHLSGKYFYYSPINNDD